MATLNSATLALTTTTGVPYDLMRDRARQLRAAGALPTSSIRGGGAPQMNKQELVSLFFAAMVTGQRDRCAGAVTSLRVARFKRTDYVRHQRLDDGSVQMTSSLVADFDSMTPEQQTAVQPFGDFIETLVEQATTAAGRSQVETQIINISAWEDGQTAMVHTNSGRQIWFETPLDNGPPRATYASIPIRRLATVSGRILLVLADLALEARQAARNTKARSAGTLQADVNVSPRSLNRDQNNPDPTERESGRLARRGDIAEPEPPGTESNVRELKSA